MSFYYRPVRNAAIDKSVENARDVLREEGYGGFKYRVLAGEIGGTEEREGIVDHYQVDLMIPGSTPDNDMHFQLVISARYPTGQYDDVARQIHHIIANYFIHEKTTKEIGALTDEQRDMLVSLLENGYMDIESFVYEYLRVEAEHYGWDTTPKAASIPAGSRDLFALENKQLVAVQQMQLGYVATLTDWGKTVAIELHRQRQVEHK